MLLPWLHARSITRLDSTRAVVTDVYGSGSCCRHVFIMSLFCQAPFSQRSASTAGQGICFTLMPWLHEAPWVPMHVQYRNLQAAFSVFFFSHARSLIDSLTPLRPRPHYSTLLSRHPTLYSALHFTLLSSLLYSLLSILCPRTRYSLFHRIPFPSRVILSRVSQVSDRLAAMQQAVAEAKQCAKPQFGLPGSPTSTSSEQGSPSPWSLWSWLCCCCWQPPMEMGSQT